MFNKNGSRTNSIRRKLSTADTFTHLTKYYCTKCFQLLTLPGKENTKSDVITDLFCGQISSRNSSCSHVGLFSSWTQAIMMQHRKKNCNCNDDRRGHSFVLPELRRHHIWETKFILGKKTKVNSIWSRHPVPIKYTSMKSHLVYCKWLTNENLIYCFLNLIGTDNYIETSQSLCREMKHQQSNWFQQIFFFCVWWRTCPGAMNLPTAAS